MLFNNGAFVGTSFRSMIGVAWLVGCGVFLGACNGTGGKKANPQTVFNDFNNLMLAGGSQLRVPIDVAPLDELPIMLAAESGSDEDATPTIELPVLDEAFIASTLGVTDRARVSLSADEPGVWTIGCVDFDPASDLFQQQIDTCWVSSVRMTLFHEDGEAPSEEDLLAITRGDEAAEFGPGHNYGNVYEIIRGLNPDLQSYGREIAYFSLSALQLDQANSEQLVGFGLLQAQRYLSQFMGAEDLLASLAKGQPVVLGMSWPMQPVGDDEPFGHAVVLYKADFVMIPSDASTEKRLEQIEVSVNDVVVGRRLWQNMGELKENPTAMEQAVRIAQTAGDLFTETWRSIRTSRDDIDRPYRLAIRRAYVIDPLGKNSVYDRQPALPRKVILEGPELRQFLQFAVNREMASAIVPITEEEELNAVLGNKIQDKLKEKSGNNPPMPGGTQP